MKPNTHPKYFEKAKVTCACGNSFTAGSTLPEIKVEICSQCHPFFTSEVRFVDTLGRVEKFKQKQEKASKKYLKKKQRKAIKKLEAEKKEAERPKSLKEMLQKTTSSKG